MSDAVLIIIPAAIAVCLLAFLKRPLRLLIKLAVNTLFGFAALFAVNFLGGFLGLSIGINFINALTVGIFGIPGAALLLIVKWLIM